MFHPTQTETFTAEYSHNWKGKGETKNQEEKPKLKKTFNYEEDFEELGIEADKLQRNILTKKAFILK